MTTKELNLPISPNELLQILRKYGVVTASVFGSYARGDQASGSDLDIIVDYGEGVSLFDHINLKDELAKACGTDVDVLSARAVSTHLKPFIDQDKIKIL